MTEQNVQPQPPAVCVDKLKVHFPVRKGVFGVVTGHVRAVDDISFTVPRGEVFALVGESGCGKTTTAQAVIGLTPASSGTVTLSIGQWKEAPVRWEQLTPGQRRVLRRNIQIVFQDPYSSLNPRMTVWSILEEPFRVHKLYNKKERRERIQQLMAQVGLSESYLSRYPHEFSGGQRQRIGIARALATGPELIIADEPVSALDVSIQAQIINLLQELQSTYNQTMLFISHDLAVVRHLANRLAVMYLGHIVETGTENQIFSRPLHPYTRLLLDSVPVPGRGRNRKDPVSTEERTGDVPETGCSFYPRCSRRKDDCLAAFPPLTERADGHATACYFPCE
jgi:oligopeptide transport system ATP-binding protein